MKARIIFIALLALVSNSFAQVTKEQADEIILQYIIDEEMRTDVLLLETTSMLPNAEGISTITTHLFGNYETFSIEYPCWVYHIYEWADVNCCRPHRYLFVNKVTGNILEVKTKGSPYNPNPENWQLVSSAISGLPDIDSEFGVFYFPNPVNDFFTISDPKQTVSRVEIFDVFGKKVYSQLHENTVNMSSFSTFSL